MPTLYDSPSVSPFALLCYANSVKYRLLKDNSRVLYAESRKCHAKLSNFSALKKYEGFDVSWLRAEKVQVVCSFARNGY